MKQIKHIIILLAFTAMAYSAMALPAPSNDDCSTAVNLGTLPAPAACTGTSKMVGASVTASGTTVGATPEAIYPYLSNCPINTASPPNDVWYSFVASSFQVVVNISGSTMTNPVITVWTGACGTLTGMGCVTGAGGAANLTIYQTVPGQTYYIQIAGSTSAQNGTFNLTVHNDHDCAQCLVSSSISATPLPVNGAYGPGQTVTFCLNITQYNEIVSNWMHGVQPVFGAGWDLTTLVPGTPPPSLDHAGSWAYYPAGVTSTATGTLWPAGFYYNSTNPHGLVGGPGNSYGDNCQGNCSWQFCFTITTKSVCNPGVDLSVALHTSADGESGTWTSPGCASDPIASISAIGACCPPVVSSAPDTCGNGLGSATASAVGSSGPWTYQWSKGTPAVQTVNGPSTVHGLTAGIVGVTVTDRFNCTSSATINVIQTSFAGPNQGASCVTSLPGGSVTMGALSTGIWSIMAGNPGTCNISNVNDPHAVISNFTAAGTYSFLFSRAGGCIDTAQVVVTVKPNAGGDRVVPCLATYPSGSATMGASVFAGASWSALAGNPGTATITTPTSNTTTIKNFSAPGVYYWVWTNPSGCLDTATTTVTAKPNAGPDQTQNCVILPGAPATLSATAVAGGVWSAIATNPAVASISSATSTTPTISNLTAGGTYNFVWTAGNGCTDTAAVNINPLPIAPPATASVGTICVGSSTNLVATSAGNNILWYTTATGGVPLTTVASGTPYSVSPATTTTYYAEAQSIGGTFTQTFTYTDSAQTFTVPAGATSMTVYAWGGGGAGGGTTQTGSQSQFANGGGGGGGACSSGNVFAVTSGQTYTINIGAGGTGGNGNGGGGGTTTVSGLGGSISAAGGAGGTGDPTGNSASTQAGGAGGSTGTTLGGGVIYAGGSGSSGINNTGITGTGGGGAGSGGAGTTPTNTCAGAGTGGAGVYAGGTGGHDAPCGTTTNAAGTPGNAPGGGGGGDNNWSAQENGGNGGAGQVVIVYTIPTCTSTSRTPVTVTVVPIPVAPTVTGGGSFCNSAVLTATGGTGTIYWQNTTAGGTSTATPSSSQTVAASGTYYFNTYNGVCFGPDASATVTIVTGPAAPSASAAPASICAGASSTLTATSAGNTINWWTAATGGSLLTSTASGATYSVTPASTTTYYAEAQAASAPVVTTISSSGTWTVPAGVTSATVYLWGGGGGGGAARSNSGVSGGGGGGGALGYTTIAGLTPGNNYTITIGAGGTGGSGSAGAAAGTGGTTTFTGPLGTWTANGGAGGTDNNGGTSGNGGAGANSGSGSGMTYLAGGNGSNGVTAGNIVGEGGGGGGSTGAGANGATTCTGVAAAGGSGAYPGGNGGYNANCGTNASLAGANGSAAGGGASGAHRGNNNSQNGGTGGNGQVVIVYSVATCPSTRTPVTVTVNNVPTAVTVSGAGTFCGSATLTATGGTGGTIYWQGITSNGTSTATASTSQVVTTSGTYYFRANNGCGWGTQGSVTVTINPYPVVPAITGTTSVCAGSTTTLSDATAGGAWSSSNNAIATVSAGGVVTGVAAGSSTITYTVTNGSGCVTAVTTNVTVNALPVVAAITGTTSVCVGSTTTLSDATVGGVWSSSNAAIAAVSAGGVVTGVAAGSATITYTVTNGSGCVTAVTTTVTVNALPVVAAITGTTSVCVGATTTLSDATAGGVWSSSNTAVATISAAGVVTAVAAGSATITYTVTNGSGCVTAVTTTVTINALPVVPAITGTTSICVGSTTTLANTTAGGVWSSSLPAVATVNASGVVSGLAAGSATITYTVTNGSGCVKAVTTTVTVNALPAVAGIVGGGMTCVGSTISYTDATPGGVWSSSNNAIATVNASGSVTGVSAGTVTISYTVTNGSGCSKSATTIVTFTNCTVSISGSTFDDANGNGLIDGTDATTSLGQTIYAVLVSSTNTVLATSAVGGGGGFFFGSAPAFTNGMTIIPCTSNPAIGSVAPAASWPSNWLGTKGQYGTNNLAGAGVYGSPSAIPVNTGISGITNLLLGFDRPPVSTSQNYNIGYPTHNAVKQLIPANGLGLLAGSDPEDGGIGVGNVFTITSIAGLNGNSLYYNGTLIIGYTTITNFDPTLLTMKFTGAGSISASFQYGSTDAAGQVDPAPATYSIHWVGALPVKLMYFTAEKHDESKSMLTWATASEVDNDHFEIERSSDAQNWEKTGQVQGHGTTSIQQNYSYIDMKPIAGINYYRLKQVDVDGKFEYTNIAEVQFDNASGASITMAVYPNPVAQAAAINIAMSNSSDNINNITITNTVGQVILDQAVSEMQTNILSGLNLPEGVYFITAHTSNNKTLTSRLVVQ